MRTGLVDEIWISTGHEMTRVMFLVAGTVVEIWHEFITMPNRIGEVHVLKVDQVFVGQNRAKARLADGTPISLRITSRDKVQAGNLDKSSVRQRLGCPECRRGQAKTFCVKCGRGTCDRC